MAASSRGSSGSAARTPATSGSWRWRYSSVSAAASSPVRAARSGAGCPPSPTRTASNPARAPLEEPQVHRPHQGVLVGAFQSGVFDGTLGLRLLRRYTVTLDYPNATLSLIKEEIGV